MMPNIGQKQKIDAKRGFLATVTAILCLSFGTPVLAQDKPNTATVNDTKLSLPTDGLNLNLPNTSNLLSDSGSYLDLPAETNGSYKYKLDLKSSGCANGAEPCLRQHDSVKLDLSDTFRRRSEKGLDLSLTPRASVRFDDEVSSTAVGALIEIGEDLREGSEFKSNTWYFFAGADAEALTFSPNSIGQITSGEFHLQDRIIVGDAQAGLGYRIGDADVSLSYMRRESTTDEFKFKEDAAALSFTWKR